ncbi:MAG: hypothetical protein ABIY46_15150 [Gemmatimonadales bacterium]
MTGRLSWCDGSGILILPLALAALAAAACGPSSDGTEQAAARASERDLTLSSAEAPGLEIASPVELARRPIQPAAESRPSPKPATRSRAAARPRAIESTTTAEAPVPVVAPTPAPGRTESAVPATPASWPPNPNELAPGESVTILPASSGPSSEPSWTDELPADGRRGIAIGAGPNGGNCPPRGAGGRPRGIGGGGFRGLR